MFHNIETNRIEEIRAKQPQRITDSFHVITVDYDILPRNDSNPWRTNVLAKDGNEAVQMIQQILRKPIRVNQLDERSLTIDAISPSQLKKISKIYGLSGRKESLSEKLREKK